MNLERGPVYPKSFRMFQPFFPAGRSTPHRQSMSREAAISLLKVSPENSLTENEGHSRRCSLFSIERQFPKLDVAGSIPVWTAGAHPENKVGPALATLSGNIRLISTAGIGGQSLMGEDKYRLCSCGS